MCHKLIWIVLNFRGIVVFAKAYCRFAEDLAFCNKAKDSVYAKNLQSLLETSAKIITNGFHVSPNNVRKFWET